MNLITPVPFTQVRFNDHFWTPRIETNHTVTLHHIHKMLEETGRISAFDLDFERKVPSDIVLIFGDSDTAKWIEACCYSLATHPDTELEDLVNEVINKIISAQQPDGYLNTHFIRTQPEMRWKNLRDWHEMYCAGHLMEAAVAHYEATGQRKFLDALCRYADHIDARFGPEEGKKKGYPGHPEIELALVRLYHATGNQRYLDLASYMIDERGQSGPYKPHYYDLEAIERGEDPAKFWAKSYEYNQSHKPIREQEKVVGHAVRAMYLFSAVADLAREKDDASLLETCERLWDNLVNRRMYITGGIGPSHNNEGFTSDYDLPDETAYAETCATIGLILWNYRLLQFNGDSRFADVLERGLYNAFLSGISLEGNTFNYVNPLSSAGNHHHVPWFTCPCCPPNVARVIASLGNYIYSIGNDGLWVHLFAGNQSDIEIAGQKVQINEETLYPWDGTVKLTLNLQQPTRFTIYLRVPGWCLHYTVAINGETVNCQPEMSGYLALTRQWKAGDMIDYTMDMPVQAIFANPAVRQLQGRVAIQRGPIIYCIEGIDHNQMILDRISINPTDIASFTAKYRPDLLGGVAVIHGVGMYIEDADWQGELYRSDIPRKTAIQLTAVPYCVWDNREPGEMRVWLRAD